MLAILNDKETTLARSSSRLGLGSFVLCKYRCPLLDELRVCRHRDRAIFYSFDYAFLVNDESYAFCQASQPCQLEIKKHRRSS